MVLKFILLMIILCLVVFVSAGILVVLTSVSKETKEQEDLEQMSYLADIRRK